MYIGPLYMGPFHPRWDDPIYHVWIDSETDPRTKGLMAISACGIRKLHMQVTKVDDFRLDEWDDREKTTFRRCKKCDAWRKKNGAEALVAEALGKDGDEGMEMGCSRGIPLQEVTDVIRSGGAVRRGAVMRTR